MGTTESEAPTERLSWSQKLGLLWGAVHTNTALAVLVLGLSLVAAVLEGVGIGFILPIVELASSGDASEVSGDGLLSYFVWTYETLGVPFTLQTIIAGVSIVMAVRFGIQFLLAWVEAVLEAEYIRGLRTRAFASVLASRIEHLDDLGSDELLNAIITQTEYHSAVISQTIRFVQQLLLGTVYLGVALLLAPQLTILAIGAMATIAVLAHHFIESGYDTGSELAEANARIQETTQAGVQGARDVRLYGMRTRVFGGFADAIDTHTRSYINLERNNALLVSCYTFASAMAVFGLIYISLEVYALSVGSFAVFLFAVFRLIPVLSSLNSLVYGLDGELPHLVETQRLVARLEGDPERVGEGVSAPARVDRIDLDHVSYDYPDGTPAIRDLSLAVERGETVAFVGQSGAGKSTIVSLLTGLYDPTAGSVNANGDDVRTFDVDSWRDRLAVVRQDPFLFNETLRFNLTIANPDVSDAELDRILEATQVTEFLPTLPDGLDTLVGDDGIRLSGGQRQRVALARALLADADVLVLDEATSNLDATTERAVYDALDELDRDQLTIVIAHRLSTVTGADRIYVLDHGELVETGSHADLLTNEGAYATLFAANTATA